MRLKLITVMKKKNFEKDGSEGKGKENKKETIRK